MPVLFENLGKVYRPVAPAWEAPLGFLVEGEIYCPDCIGPFDAEDEAQGHVYPISAEYARFSRPVTCATCAILLPVDLGWEGEEYVQDRVLDLEILDPEDALAQALRYTYSHLFPDEEEDT